MITRHSRVHSGDSVDPSSPSTKKPTTLRSQSGIFLMNMLNGQIRYLFTVTGRRSDGSSVKITIDAGSRETRALWIDAIEVRDGCPTCACYVNLLYD